MSEDKPYVLSAQWLTVLASMFCYSSVARNLSQLICHHWSMFFLFSMALLAICKWHTLVLVRDRYVLVCNMLFLLQQWHTLYIMLLNCIHVYLVHYATTVDTETSQRPLVFPLSCCDQVSTTSKHCFMMKDKNN